MKDDWWNPKPRKKKITDEDIVNAIYCIQSIPKTHNEKIIIKMLEDKFIIIEMMRNLKLRMP